jgi:hypothetical protein
MHEFCEAKPMEANEEKTTGTKSEPCRPAVCQGNTGRSVRRKPWTWTRQKELAAKLAAGDDISDERIAQELGIYTRLLYRWKKEPEFLERVEELREAFRRKILGTRFCRKEARVQVRTQLVDKCLQIIEERAKWPGMEKIPGGTTGMVLPQVRNVNGKIITEYATDTATEGVIRANLREIAHEIGDWKSVNEVLSDATPPAQVVFQISSTQMAVAGERMETGGGRVIDVQVTDGTNANNAETAALNRNGGGAGAR